MTRLIARAGKGSITAALVVAFALTATACEKSGSSEVSKAALSALPKDADIFFGARIGELVKSTLWKKYVAPRYAESDDYKEMVAACGKDPLTEIESITGTVNVESNLLAIVIKGISVAEVTTCGKGSDDPFSVSKEGKLTVITDDDGEKAYAHWLDEETVVFAAYTDGPKEGDEAAQKQAVLDLLAAKEGLDDNAEMKKLIGTVDSSATFYAVADVRGIPDNPAAGKWETAAGSLDLGDGVSLDARAGFVSAEVASQLAKKAQAVIGMAVMKPELAWIPEKVKISTDGKTIVAKVSLSAEDIAKLEKLGAGGAIPLPFLPKAKPASNAADQVEKIVDEVCACQDIECAQKASAQMGAISASAGDISEADKARVLAATRRMSECIQKLANAGAAEKSAAPTP